MDWCSRLDAFEELETEICGRKMKRVSFCGAGLSLGRSHGLGSSTYRLSAFRLHGVG